MWPSPDPLSPRHKALSSSLTIHLSTAPLSPQVSAQAQLSSTHSTTLLLTFTSNNPTTSKQDMPRSRGGAGPSRSAPSRPVAAPARPAAPPQQQRAASTAAHPPMQQQAPAQSQGSGLFGQMASTAA